MKRFNQLFGMFLIIINLFMGIIEILSKVFIALPFAIIAFLGGVILIFFPDEKDKNKRWS